MSHSDKVAHKAIAKQSEETAIGEVVERLTRKHSAVSPQMVADVVQNMHAKFDGWPIRDFVPLLVERNAPAELAKLSG
jgi:hypothetical protein